jgi:hypothetical protein
MRQPAGPAGLYMSESNKRALGGRPAFIADWRRRNSQLDHRRSPIGVSNSVSPGNLRDPGCEGSAGSHIQVSRCDSPAGSCRRGEPETVCGVSATIAATQLESIRWPRARQRHVPAVNAACHVSRGAAARPTPGCRLAAAPGSGQGPGADARGLIPHPQVSPGTAASGLADPDSTSRAGFPTPGAGL